jgi:hypothetical protein
MKTKLTVFFILIVLCRSLLIAQTDSCKVLVKDLAGTYRGECLNGLANGKGTAKGKDTYVGNFVSGFPEGKGKYTYENGNVFTGFWSKGLKNGEGKFIYFIENKKYVQEGFWKNDDYIGLSNPDDYYRIINRSGTENFEIKKVNDNQVKIKISFSSAMLKYIPDNLQVKTSRGQVSQENKSFSIYNYIIPNQIDISYTIKTSAGIKVSRISFEILKLGDYEIEISNIE